MSFERFLEIAREHGRGMVPIVRELVADTLTPVTAFLRLRAGGRPAFLLESVEGGERIGRYSFLGTDPFAGIRADGTRTEILGPEGEVTRVEERSFFDVLQEEVDRFAAAASRVGLPPFTGGAVGYIGYDTIRLIERIPDRHSPAEEMPDAVFYLHDTVVAFDHARHRMLLVANVYFDSEDWSEDDAKRKHDDAERKIDSLEETLRKPVDGEAPFGRIPELEPQPITKEMRSNFTQEAFESAVVRAKEYIAAGDAFQIVLSQSFEKETSADPFAVYRILRAVNPSPYLFFFQFADAALFGSSPEILVKVQDRTVSVRPIAGTRRRGKDDAEDEALKAELLADEKELAEHRMLVDLGRNDVGRVACFGTVELSQYMNVERYSHVMHIVSQVEGRLRDDQTALDAFKAGFPAGTVSGAPKIRAMEIIDELEPSRRGFYSGAVGYLDFAGNLDTGIAIRTILFRNGKARVQAGAGIVADSVPEREYFETIHKATALSEAVRIVEAGNRSDQP